MRKKTLKNYSPFVQWKFKGVFFRLECPCRLRHWSRQKAFVIAKLIRVRGSFAFGSAEWPGPYWSTSRKGMGRLL